MESGLQVATASVKAKLRPPFALDYQLIANPIIPSDLLEEQTRLRKILRDETLESMHKQLWYAGRKGNISPLHHQKVIRRDIVLTERARLHLVWFDKTIYIKRLDDELLSWEYFSKIGCNNEVVHRAASGFLLSYTHLIEYPSEDLLTTTSAGKSGVPSGPVSCTTLLTAVASTTATSMENSASADSTRSTA